MCTSLTVQVFPRSTTHRHSLLPATTSPQCRQLAASTYRISRLTPGLTWKSIVEAYLSWRRSVQLFVPYFFFEIFRSNPLNMSQAHRVMNRCALAFQETDEIRAAAHSFRCWYKHALQMNDHCRKVLTGVWLLITIRKSYSIGEIRKVVVWNLCFRN